MHSLHALTERMRTMGRPPKPQHQRQTETIEVRVTPTFKSDFCGYTTRELRRGVSSVVKELFERELRTKSLLGQAPSYLEPSPSEREVSFSPGQENGGRIMPSTEPQSPARHYHIESPEYGLAAVFESEDKSLRYGVAVYPFRHSAVLLVVDLSVTVGEFGRLDLAKNIAPDLDEALNLSPYNWETPKYRNLCERLGLNPDHRRPKYMPTHKELADRIVAEIDKDCDTDWNTLSRKNFWHDFLDLIRIEHHAPSALFERVKRDAFDYEDAPFAEEIAAILDEMDDEKLAQSPQTFAVVHFLPSAFGCGFNASLISREGEGCEPDGWHTQLYQGLGGIALDVETDSQWLKTVRRHLLEQGVIFVPRKVADVYMQTEGAYWIWSNGGYTMFTEIKARTPTRWEALIWQYRRPNTPLSNASVVNFNVARIRNGHYQSSPPPRMVIAPVSPAEESAS